MLSKTKQSMIEFAESEMLIAKDCKYPLNDYRTRLNNNVLIVGGSGCGKTRNVVTPNIAQAVGSYIISDPKGDLYNKYREYLKLRGYKVLLVDFTHPERSVCYNPLHYVNTSQEIMKLANLIIDDKITASANVDMYWDRISMVYLQAIIAYMKEAGHHPMTFNEILRLVEYGIRDSDNDDCKTSRLSRMFDVLKSKNPGSWACRQFNNANAAPYRTYDTMRSTLNAKFSKMASDELDTMMNGDPFDFNSMALEKTAVFVVVSDTDRTMDTLANIFFSQAIHSLCEFADNKCKDNRLPIPVRFILDDFATNCKIDEFPRIISSIRSRAISVMLMVQSEAQLAQGYGDDASTIIANCDTYAYLGGSDLTTAANIGERTDTDIRDILSMPIGSCYVFRRGSKHVYTQLLDGGEYIAQMHEAVNAHKLSERTSPLNG